jgi:DNA-binding CsgD family transcriptional regulator
MASTDARLAVEALEWPLIGRDAELERIERLRKAGEPGVVIAAGAGVGKSSVARHAVAAARADGLHTAWVQATQSAAAVPLGAFAALLPAGGAGASTLDVMRGMAAELRERAGGRAAVLGVDDGQLLDPTSAALVLHLVLTRAAFLVVTVRTGEPTPDAVESLWKDAGVPRLQLEALREPDTGRLVEAVLGGPVEQAARRWMQQSSRGNALYVRELLVGALADGALEDRQGFWRLAHRPRPSTSLAAVIGERLAVLGAEERRALELLALGEPLRVGELETLVGLEALAGVERRGLIAVGDDGAVRVAHPLYGEVVRSGLSALRAHGHRLRLAEVVGEREPREPGDALRVAGWLLDAAHAVPARLAVDAAGAAVLAGDPDLGARLAQHAREAGAGPIAGVLLARAEAQRNRPEVADALLAEAEREVEDPDLALEITELHALLLFWAMRRPAEALAMVERAVARRPDPGWRRRVEPLRLYLVFLAESPQEALAGAEAALADPPEEARGRRRMEITHAAALAFSGGLREAAAQARRLRPEIPLSDINEEVALDIVSVVGLDAGEDLQEHGDWLARTIDAGVRVNDQTAAAIAALHLACVRRLAGRFTDARRWADEAVAHFERRDTFGFVALAHSVVADVARETGDAERARLAAAQARAALAEEDAHPAERVWLVRGQASALLAAGERQGAQQLLLGAVDVHQKIPAYAAVLRYEAMRAGAPARGLVEPMRALAERCDARGVDDYLAHVEARAAGDGTALLAAAERFAQTGADRYACEAAAHAAEAFAAAGRADSARRAAARSRELFAEDEGGTLPPVSGLDATETTLTAREEEIAGLAARGLGNAEIAERLVLSVRTVETHLYRAMGKLGVSDRRDLR